MNAYFSTFTLGALTQNVVTTVEPRLENDDLLCVDYVTILCGGTLSATFDLVVGVRGNPFVVKRMDLDTANDKGYSAVGPIYLNKDMVIGIIPLGAGQATPNTLVITGHYV